LQKQNIGSAQNASPTIYNPTPLLQARRIDWIQAQEEFQGTEFLEIFYQRSGAQSSLIRILFLTS
jgi:hypothetical protein